MAAVKTEIKAARPVEKPSPKPRMNVAGKEEEKVAASTTSVGNRPVPKPRKKSSASSTDLEEPLPDYVNSFKMDQLRVSIIGEESPHTAVKHVLDVENRTVGRSSSEESADEDCQDYINENVKDYINAPVFLGGRTRPVREERDELKRANPLPVQDSQYVDMSPVKLPVELDADNTYVQMKTPARGSIRSEDENGSPLYQVPTSKLFIQPLKPSALVGIYEINNKENPLHPRHSSSSAMDMKPSSTRLTRQTVSDVDISKMTKPNKITSQLSLSASQSYSPRTPPPSIPLPEPPLGSSPQLRPSLSELSASWSPQMERNPQTDNRSSDTTLKKLLTHMPGSPGNRRAGSPRLPPIKSGFHGRLSRANAEKKLNAAENTVVGDYLLRESNKPTKGKTQIVISLKTTDVPMHVIVDYREDQYWLSSSEKNQISFSSIDGLLLHYTRHPIVVDGKGNRVNLSKPLELKRKSSSP